MIHDQNHRSWMKGVFQASDSATTTCGKARQRFWRSTTCLATLITCVSPMVFGGFFKWSNSAATTKNTSANFVFQLLPSCALQGFFACLFHRSGRFRGRFGGRSRNHRRYGGQRYRRCGGQNYRRRGDQNHRRRCGQWWGRWKSGSRMSILALVGCDDFCGFDECTWKTYESTMLF